MNLLKYLYPEFITYLILLDIMIISVFIPVAYSSIQKVINLFGETAGVYFKSKKSIRFLILTVLFHLLYVLAYTSIQNPSKAIEHQEFVIAIILFTFMEWCFIILAAYNIARFGFDRRFIRKCFIKDINYSFKRNNPNQYYKGINDYGEYIYQLLKMHNVQPTQIGIEDFENNFNNILELQNSDIVKFNKFLFSKEFLEETDTEKRQYLLLYDRNNLPVLNLIEQIQQLFNYSTENKIDEISFNAQVSLIRLLRKISSIPNMNLLVDKILSVLEDTSIKTFIHNHSESYSSLEWYTLCVFNDYDEKRIHMDYVDLFNKSLFSILRISAKNRYTHAIRAFMRLSHNGLYYDYNGPKYQASSLTDLMSELDQDVYSKIYMMASKLVNNLGLKVTKHKLDIFYEQFKKFKQEVSELDVGDKIDAINEYMDKIQISVEEKFKYDEYKVLINYLLSYCISQNLIKNVIEFWQFKQPDDAEAHYTGNDVFEKNIFNFFDFYYKDRDFYHARYEFHEDHHGTLKYLNQYNALRLAYSFRHLNEIDVNKFFEFPTHSVDLIFGLERSIPQMIEFLNQEKENDIYYEIFSHKEIAFKMAVLQLTEIMNNLDRYKSIYVEQSTIIPEKIYDISSNLIKNYKNNRKINSIINDTISARKLAKKEGKEAKSKFIEDKAAIIDWRVDYSSYGRYLGESIADRENAILFNQISSNSKTYVRLNEDGLKKQFNKIVTKKKTINLILMNRGFGWEFLRENNYIRKPKEVDGIFNNKNVSWILIKNEKKIPIIVVKAPPVHFRILLLNTDKVFIDFEDRKNNSISWDLFTNSEKYTMNIDGKISNRVLTNNEKQDLDNSKFELEISIFPYYKFYKNKTITCIDIVNG